MDESLTPTQLHQQAIMAALSAKWEEALRLNQLIIENDPKNIEALNRTGRAYFELGNLAESKNYFDQALVHDPYNQIAAKFLKRLETFNKKGLKHPTGNTCAQIDSDLFIEEPGKTRVATLLKVAEPQKLSLLSPGSVVSLIAKNRGVAIVDQYGEYLGVLPDDLSHHLIRLIKGGNKYQAFIKTVKTNGLSILIREVFRSARFKNQSSFLDSTGTFAYSSNNIFMPNEGEEEPYEGDEESN